MSRLSGHEVKAKSLTPEVKLDADYVLEGQLLLLPIRGKGTCTITLGESKNYFPGIMDSEKETLQPPDYTLVQFLFALGKKGSGG